MTTAPYDLIILGAGGAGLFCAGVAAQRGRRVLLLDHAASPGEKIRISGGGRCNFTNLHCGPDDFLSENPHFAKSALKRYSQHDFIALVESHGIAWHEKTQSGMSLGQLFCDGSSKQIIAMLLAECRKGPGDVDLRLSTRITDVAKTGSGFRVETDGGRFEAAKLVIATGGPSIPKMGASGFAYDLAKRFGLNVIAPKPALVPLLLPPDALNPPLAGVSTLCTAAHGRRKFTEAMLFTHRGLSGPAILQISSYWQRASDQPVTLDLAPGLDLLAELKSAKAAHPKQDLATALARHLPARLAADLAGRHGGGGRMADLPDALLARVAANVKQWRIQPSGTEGYARAEVTLGGIDTAELSSQTMEAKAVPGLYAIGEAVDVTGHLGGFNFQWAWSSGYAAGMAV